ncbi:protein arginine n-methyltransferase, putative [Eimeria mitis]|uniref:Protein arginine n-methyltransferase, putative n=1 Tax=Eimeria mitis TaxID=44415 RepID=U6KDH7_9EIME|nr:protein arginine n-methyltransferase, putative [Eimeria mitis]CDJ36075.1 protein arginine n-methyltransferase, putative [Eimeria mitis]
MAAAREIKEAEAAAAATAAAAAPSVPQHNGVYGTSARPSHLPQQQQQQQQGQAEQQLEDASHDHQQQDAKHQDADALGLDCLPRIIIYVVGAGRGPLVQAALDALRLLNIPPCFFFVAAIEKNPQALFALRDRQINDACKAWRYVAVIPGDIRAPSTAAAAAAAAVAGAAADGGGCGGDAVGKGTPRSAAAAAGAAAAGSVRCDIMVSELLGSFGDNELSPECIDRAQHLLLKEEGVSIPAAYLSSLEPVSCPLLHAAAAAAYATPQQLDGMFVVNPHGVLRPSVEGPKTCFCYHHPNLLLPPFAAGAAAAAARMHAFTQSILGAPAATGEAETAAAAAAAAEWNGLDFRSPFGVTAAAADTAATAAAHGGPRDRMRLLDWSFNYDCIIHGFLGYFFCCLYGDVFLSIDPRCSTKDMVSWFPALLLLRQPLMLQRQQQLVLSITRRCDNHKVWFERTNSSSSSRKSSSSNNNNSSNNSYILGLGELGLLLQQQQQHQFVSSSSNCSSSSRSTRNKGTCEWTCCCCTASGIGESNAVNAIGRVAAAAATRPGAGGAATVAPAAASAASAEEESGTAIAAVLATATGAVCNSSNSNSSSSSNNNSSSSKMVVFDLEGVRVYFPYDFIYPEQFAYIRAVKRTVQMQGHAVLEMPTGTGKTAAMMSILTSMQLADPSMGRIIYCTRTVAEMEKALLELKMVIDYRIKEIEKEKQQQHQLQQQQDEQQQQHQLQQQQPRAPVEAPLLGRKMRDAGYLLGVGLSARRSLCANANVLRSAEREKIDEGCRKRTAPWVRQEAIDRRHARQAFSSSSSNGSSSSTSGAEGDGTHNGSSSATAAESSAAAAAAAAAEAPDIEDVGAGDTSDGLCAFYENFDEYFSPQHFPAGVYTLEELKAAAVRWRHPLLQRSLPLCPYFLARRLLQVANVVVLNYQYLIDPKVSEAAVFGPSGSDGPLGSHHGGPYLVGFSRTAAQERAFQKQLQQQKQQDPQQQQEQEQQQQQQQEDWLSTDMGASVVVFDEAHNIDNVCIEALSVHLNKNTLDQALRNLTELSEDIKRRKAQDSERLRAEYHQLLQGMQLQQQRRREQLQQQSQPSEQQQQQSQPTQQVVVTAETFQALANPVLPSDVVEEVQT